MSNPSAYASREDQAAAEIGVTDIRPGVAAVLAACFLFVIFAVPFVQCGKEFRAARAAGDGCFVPFGLGAVGRAVGEGSTEGHADETRSLPRRILAVNRAVLRNMNAYETGLADDAWLTAWLLEPVQGFLTRFAGVGTEQAYAGRDGWLYYRPDVDYCTGPGFLDTTVQERRRHGGDAWERAVQPDPRPAMIQFHQQLAECGIQLVLMPTPVKPVIHPEHFSGRYAAGSGPVQNTDYAAFLSFCEGAAIPVFDGLAALVPGQGNNDRYLKTDTHWRPEAMQDAAEALKVFLDTRVELSPPSGERLQSVNREVSNLGDVAAMMHLPEGQSLYSRETVAVAEVQRNGAPWTPDPGAEVLLLGDSFSNIYALEEMGWGRSAGFAAHLSLALNRPIDAILRNDAGAHATREILSRELQRGDDRLAGKKVVVWQFAARELAAGDWRIDTTQMELGERGSGRFVEVAAGSERGVRGVVKEISSAPRPGTVTYVDHVVYAHIVDIEATDGLPMEEKEAHVAMYSMRDNDLMAAARLRSGDEIEMILKNYDAVDRIAGVASINSSVLDSDATYEIPVWGELPATGPGPVAGESPWGLADWFTCLGVLAMVGGVLRIGQRRELNRPAFDVAGMAALGIGTALFATGFLLPARAAESAPPAAGERADAAPASAAEADAFAGACAGLAAAGEGMTVEGLDGWLFLRAELAHLGKGTFWGPDAQAASTAGRSDRRDPLPAIVAYKEALAAEGIELLLVPVPPKATIYPDRIDASFPKVTSEPPPRVDRALAAFYAELKGSGVEVLDLAPEFLAHRDNAPGTMYCRTDTHWSGQACVWAGRAIAEHVRARPWFSSLRTSAFEAEEATVTVTGDLLASLGEGAVPAEDLLLRLVQAPIDENSPILLLTDSHGLVFHAGDDMHAKGAGLADQLACELGQSVDLIAVRGSGATPARFTLFRKARSKPGYLEQKKIVIWCFAAREFTETEGWAEVPVKKP